MPRKRGGSANRAVASACLCGSSGKKLDAVGDRDRFIRKRDRCSARRGAGGYLIVNLRGGDKEQARETAASEAR